jgi:hypothetical protein
MPAPDVTEFYLLATTVLRIVGEAENIAPGRLATLTWSRSPGSTSPCASRL